MVMNLLIALIGIPLQRKKPVDHHLRKTLILAKLQMGREIFWKMVRRSCYPHPFNVASLPNGSIPDFVGKQFAGLSIQDM